MSKRRDLTDHELAIAVRAKALWQTKKDRERITQADANKILGWSPSVFGQYINGLMPIGMEALVKLADFFGVTPYDLDPNLGKHFTPPPEDIADIQDSLRKMSDRDINRLIRDLSQRLSPQDVLTMIDILLDRLRSRL